MDDNIYTMKFWRYSILLLAVVSITAVSCKKDDKEEDTSEYLTGTLNYDMPKFVRYGDVIRIHPEGVYRGSDENDYMLSYSWYNPLTAKTDTIRVESDGDEVPRDFDFVIGKDSLATFTMTVRVWADGYYAKSASKSFTVVDPALETGSLRGYGDLSSKTSITDPRDNARYYYSTIDGADWTSQNIGNASSGKPFEEVEAMNLIFGQYYTWEEARDACPDGWALPSDAEFVSMAIAAGGTADSSEHATVKGVSGAMMGDIYFNGSKLWEFWPDVKITNASGFTAIPTGFATVEDGKYEFKGYGGYAMYWTADEKDSDLAYVRYIYVDKPDLYCTAADKKGIAASVRCVRR